MRPYPEEVLQGIQAVVMTHALPEAQTDYTRSALSLSLVLAGIVAGRIDGIVESLTEENRKMRELLAEARSALGRCKDGNAKSLADALKDVEKPGTTSLKVSEQRKEYERLRGELSKLAPLAERSLTDDSLEPLRPVRAALIAYLRAEASSRAVPILG